MKNNRVEIKSGEHSYWMDKQEYENLKNFYEKHDPFYNYRNKDQHVILHNQKFEDEVNKEIKNIINKEII